MRGVSRPGWVAETASLITFSYIAITTSVTMSSLVPESAIEDSPPPQPEAGPSSGRNRIEDAFRDFDVESFDWNAYEGTYKGKLTLLRGNQS